MKVIQGLEVLVAASLLTLSLQHLVNETLSDPLVSFVDGAFERSIRVLYLVGLAKRNLSERFLSLPYPKVLFDANTSLGQLDASCLVVVFIDFGNVNSSLDSFRVTFGSVGKMPWNARVLVLVEEGYIKDRTANLLLRNWFKHYGISYWAITSIGGTLYAQYSLDYGHQPLTVHRALEFEKLYTYHRLIIDYFVPIHVQVFITFPYMFLNKRKKLEGIDCTLFNHLFYYLKLNAYKIDIDGSTSRAMLQSAVKKLFRSEVDFRITRTVSDIPDLPKIVIPETIDFCLVVPRQTKVIFLNNLFQPFTIDLWIFIFCLALLLYGAKMWIESDTKIGRFIRATIEDGPLSSFWQLSVSFVEFILIESYLARITSLLLVYQFEQEPDTLVQFLATDIPIQLLDDHTQFVHTLGPTVSAAILKRAVYVPVLDKTSDTFAYFESVGRATYTIAVLQNVDPLTDRKRSYILPETLGGHSAAYLFARNAGPLRDYVAIHLDWMRAFGYVILTDRLHNNMLDSDRRRVKIVQDVVQVEHMVPFMIFLSLVWTISTVAFVGEIFVHTVENMLHLRRA